jgi:hypothetical protein
MPLHHHIHGAKMGFRSEDCWCVGGFTRAAPQINPACRCYQAV